MVLYKSNGEGLHFSTWKSIYCSFNIKLICNEGWLAIDRLWFNLYKLGASQKIGQVFICFLF